MALLARVADRLYWAGRYLERAEDTARIVRATHDLIVDLPVTATWHPLAAVTGSVVPGEVDPSDPLGETAVLSTLIADIHAPSSIVHSISAARENLRTTREVIPREAWQAVNGLSQYALAAAPGSVGRAGRDRFLARVMDDCRRIDGVIESTMTRANPFRLHRLGRLIERADMTTRVLGVRAAGLLRYDENGATPAAEDVQWMGVLRSLSALQMYQRATKDSITGEAVVQYLLYYAPFPRSVQFCFDEIRALLNALPSPQAPLAALDAAETVLADARPTASDGHTLDDAMDAVQLAIGALDRAIHANYVAPTSGAIPGVA